MPKIVLKFPLTAINEILLFYSDIQVETPKNNSYIAYSFKCPEFRIDIYTSNTVIFDGILAEKEVLIWESKALKSSAKEVALKEQFSLSHYGSDEVGTGSYFGPITVCAAYVSNEDIDWLKRLGVGDSKGIADHKILELTPQITKRITYSNLVLDNKKYNQLIAQGMQINIIKAKMHNRALLNITKKINDLSALVVVDQFVNPHSYYQYLADEKEVYDNIHFEVKAENKYLAVACASIIARFAFLQNLDELSKKAKIKIPSGAGANVDIIAKKLLGQIGEKKLLEYVKWDFKNTERIKTSD